MSFTFPYSSIEESAWTIIDYPPGPLLSPFIHRIYSLESLTKPSEHPELWIPSGTVELVIDLEAPFQQAVVGKALETRPQAFVTGLFEKCLCLKPTGNIRQIGVVFKVGAFSRFSDYPYYKIKGRIIPVSEVFGKSAVALLSAMGSGLSTSVMIEEVHSFLCSLLKPQPLVDNPFIDHCLKAIDDQKGYLAISNLLDGRQISPRHFRRIFKRYTGISPKKYTRLIRLLHMVKKAHNKEVRLSTLADDHGFYDVSHVYHEFKKATGMLPRQYLQYPQPLSRLFFQ